MNKNVEKIVAIRMGYDCTVLVPVSKAGPMMALLASCQICSSEWIGDRPGKESCSVMLLRDNQIEMKLGDFEVLTREGLNAEQALAQKHKEDAALAAAGEEGPF